jgi:hypothetical protein
MGQVSKGQMKPKRWHDGAAGKAASRMAAAMVGWQAGRLSACGAAAMPGQP